MNVIFFTLSGNSKISYLYMLLLFDASLFPCKLFTKWLVILKLSKLGKKSNKLLWQYIGVFSTYWKTTDTRYIIKNYVPWRTGFHDKLWKIKPIFANIHKIIQSYGFTERLFEYSTLRCIRLVKIGFNVKVIETQDNLCNFIIYMGKNIFYIDRRPKKTFKKV